MSQRNALDTFSTALLCVRAVLTAPGPKASRTHAQRYSRETIDRVLTLVVWLVTLLVLPAVAGLAKLLAS